VAMLALDPGAGVDAGRAQLARSTSVASRMSRESEAVTVAVW
jgi:hypothetical protein